MWRRKKPSSVSRGAKQGTSTEPNEISIYELIRSNRGPNGWLHGQVELPTPSGAFANTAAPSVASLCELWVAASHQPTPAGIIPLANALRGVDIESFVDELLERISVGGPSRVGLQEVAVHLIRTTGDPSTVKCSIAVMGAAGLDNVDGGARMIHLLGLHDELSLFAAVAFVNGTADAEGNLFRLAKDIHGDSRVHCADRLSGTKNPEIRDWLQREGFIVDTDDTDQN